MPSGSKGEYREGRLAAPAKAEAGAEATTKLPAAFRTTAGTLFVVGVAALISMG